MTMQFTPGTSESYLLMIDSVLPCNGDPVAPSPNTITIDPDKMYDAHPAAPILFGDIQVLLRKAGDYSPRSAFENFDTASYFTKKVTGTEMDRIHSCLLLIGTKISRIMTVGLNKPKNESLYDTLSDLRVYLAIFESMLRERDNGGG